MVLVMIHVCYDAHYPSFICFIYQVLTHPRAIICNKIAKAAKPEAKKDATVKKPLISLDDLDDLPDFEDDTPAPSVPTMTAAAKKVATKGKVPMSIDLDSPPSKAGPVIAAKVSQVAAVLLSLFFASPIIAWMHV
jgi:hypothetical protein